MYPSQTQTDRIDAAFKMLGLRGVTIFAASGDGGSHFSFEPFSPVTAIARALNKVACQYNLPTYPASSPYVVGVGGSTWQAPASAAAPQGWSGSGGGFSWGYAQPAFQRDAVEQYLRTTAGLPPTASFNASGRAFPDLCSVSINVPMCIEGHCQNAGGTSASTPEVAGVFSLITHLRLRANLPPLGFVTPRIYQTAANFPGEAFHDITQGNTRTSCATGFPATPGWDPQTGVGRIIWAGLRTHFANDKKYSVVLSQIHKL